MALRILLGISVVCLVLWGMRPTLKNVICDNADPNWEIPAEWMENPQTLTPILNQTFTYFSKGSQSYVYLSADGQYVLKFLKQNKLRGEDRNEKKIKTFNAIKTALQLFRKETGILYAHLTSSQPFCQIVHLVDRHGKEHHIDLNFTHCLLQKRANLIYPRIDALMELGESEKAHAVILSVLDLLAHLGSAGVIDNDPILRKNFGLIDDQAVQIDIGRMQIDPDRVDGTQYTGELRSITTSFGKWIYLNHPTLSPFFEEALQRYETCDSR